ncbi:MAG: hypothetical protein COW04_02150 [Deltaproteobacteria bacterium CG12_big_fil_rev_8_21_14_0_65_43_10]|nr:MAG: hypothetical protein AUK23_10270 [Deltaproteobacteria bacterium CG2_30_43_15]PIQ46437.1 MAG: hypothetical protein COW04_02150 [Deltaproteobacteria bacterium CG12_big_fil_rev_8_21_14_0_65_43_10]PIU86317.1 MAG: DUF503 domain-containing protein [Deltaproteobacteria bacterium CG06_land_8_20_14_3_00_44_19]PIX26387.1 MAG: DUF503 domain-containing protein [Deltaproteobacteria bacterium CG_4_8_14_3_um_filter_43_13]PJB43861.1 MAG: DUF503 domain-containing protein [Deltaproteobacteria bacterium C
MVIGVCRLDIMIHDNSSLKGKRQALKRVIDRVKQKFNVSIAEVGENDKWQRAQVGFCVVGNDKRYVNSSLDKIANFINDLRVVDLLNSEIEILDF